MCAVCYLTYAYEISFKTKVFFIVLNYISHLTKSVFDLSTLPTSIFYPFPQLFTIATFLIAILL